MSQSVAGISEASSELSSLPESIDLPEAGSNSIEPHSSSIPEVFLAKKSRRSSHIWLPDNGYAVEVNGKLRWKCKRCEVCGLLSAWMLWQLIVEML